MFNNSGSKIKDIAWIAWSAETVLAFITAVSIWGILRNLLSTFSDGNILAVLAAVVLFALLVFLGWLFSLILYAFGELVENSTDIRQTIAPHKKSTDNISK